MPYPEYICAPMRTDLTSVGFEELKTAEDVEKTIPVNQGTVLLFMNSVCGCAAGAARPGVKLALKEGKVPAKTHNGFRGTRS